MKCIRQEFKAYVKIYLFVRERTLVLEICQALLSRRINDYYRIAQVECNQ